ncbi:dnaJ homolog subfamily C member 3 [Copidosoma floridanum]|uniref:dnaJ homolog subfamily C member 3 n=1 Tax=Copidosoma floridanum TaxID=29053 RepID=UPI0006C9DC12|nr:dnaJ homolog subfamily C member 3 [Copidosoma floridanum]
MYRYGLFIVLLNIGWDVSANKGLDRLLELGTDFLSKGRFQDALQYFHEAVEKDPNNYLVYYKRGTVYLALGKAKQALTDFDQVLEYKPDLSSVRIQRGNIHLKNADLDKADQDFRVVFHENYNDEEAQIGMHKVSLAKEFIENAEYSIQQEDYNSAIEDLTKAIEICPWSFNLRELRAKCYKNVGDPYTAVHDLKSALKLKVDNTKGYFELATLLYLLGRVEESLEEIKHCLKLDPEHKDCFPLYKKIKKVAKSLTDAERAKESENWSECIQKANNILKHESSVAEVRFIGFKLLCKAHTANNEASNALENCQAAQDIIKSVDSNDVYRIVDILCDTAEAYLSAELYDDAVMKYNEALKLDSGNERAKSGLQNAEQQRKKSESRDYYKILQVPRNAKKQQIVKAYRKAAQKWHPDNYPDPMKKKEAEKKFIDIAAAKEVLTDDQKRAEFDAGRDPLDPESGRHEQGFHSFHNFHQGSPFHFKFHFN